MSAADTFPFEPPGKAASIALAIAVHAMLIGFLLYGVHWQTRVAPEAVEVELVRAQPAPSVQARPPPAPPQPRVEPRVEPRPEPRPEIKPPPKADIELKDKKPKPTAKPEAKPEPKPEAKPKPVEKPEPRPALPKVDFRNQLDRELAKLEQSKSAQESAAREAAELSNRQQAQVKAAQSKAMADYEARIRGKIRGNIVPPPDLRGNPIAVFVVTQLPDGEILETRLVKSSGVKAWDDAVERAIRKSSPLPKPADPSLFERDLNLTFCPDEQRGCR